MRDSEGNLISNKEEKRSKGWTDNFKRRLNRPASATPPEIQPADAEIPVNIIPATKVEVLNAIKLLKLWKAAWSDGIPPGTLKTDAETSAVNMLTPPLHKVWKEGKVPADRLEEGLSCQTLQEEG
ncbi:unnamed protein product [Heterobilharzia americana]|nr:unnamed protein product [Heterobilharzia americana]